MKQIRLIKDGVFIDVGAYVGSYTLWASKQVGEHGLVIAIEPCPQNLGLLLYNVKNLKNVRLVPVALWSENTTLRLYGKPESPATYSVVVSKEHGSINVRRLTLDTLLTVSKLSRVDVVKIDVEGAELQVKARRIAWKKCAVCVEIHNAMLKKEVIGFLNRIFCIKEIGNHILGIRR